MEVMEIIEGLEFLVPFLIAYNVWMHNQIIKNSKDIAVNTSKDEQLSEAVKEMKGQMSEILQTVNDINIKLAKL
jgi:predicted transcriptional regulator